MPKMTPSREFYIPQGAVKVADKQSDAVAYLYTASQGSPCARVFYGKQSKPVASYRYRSDAERERNVRALFEGRRSWLSRIAERRASDKAAGRGLEVGDIVRTCWGYEQTNVEFFEITALVGDKMVELRELAQVREGTGWEQGRCVPQSGSYIGEPIRRVARDGRVKIDDVRSGSKWNTARVAGVAIGPAASWTSYH